MDFFPEFAKNLDLNVHVFLCGIFNTIILARILSKTFKKAKIIVIRKLDKEGTEADYRPIFLLNVVYKAF